MKPLPNLGHEPQSRSAQRRIIQTLPKPTLRWVVGVSVDAQRYGRYGRLWVPALWPNHETVLTVAVTQDDPRHEYWLMCLLNALREVDPVATIAAFLVAWDDLEPYSAAYTIYDYPEDWCDVAQDFICYRCGTVWQDPEPCRVETLCKWSGIHVASSPN